MIGQVLWSEGDFCNALKTYKEALSLLNRFLGNHSRNKIYLLRVIGCICIENGDIKEANEAYLQSNILSHTVESEEISESEDISEESMLLFKDLEGMKDCHALYTPLAAAAA